MTVADRGGDLVPRSSVSTLLVSLALAASGLAVTSPAAEAAWSRPGDLVKYRVCKTSVDGGDAWALTSRVRRYYRTPDARAGIEVQRGSRTVARWGSGWLDRGEVRVSTVRVAKSPKVRVYVWQEAGDRDAVTGTAAEARVLRPSRIRRCG